MKLCQKCWQMAHAESGLWAVKNVHGVFCGMKFLDYWWTMFCAISCGWVMGVHSLCK